MCHKHGNRMMQDEEDRFDPLGKFTSIASIDGFRYNHIEGFEFADVKLQENLHMAMLHERQYPTLDNQAFCYRLIKDMIAQYWASEKIAHAERVKKALEE